MVGPGVGNSGDQSREVEALLRLREVPGLGDKGIRDLVEETGSGALALRRLGVQGGLFDGSPGRKEVQAWRQRGLNVIPLTSPRYPACLLDLTDPPPLLFLRGREELLLRPAVAIVGSRRATEAGRRMAESLGRVLARAGVTVVSGMALGVDGAAHRGALAAGGDTVAVLGSGLEVVYPLAHRDLFREIARRGLLVSEFLPRERALPHHFPKRNRILAALVRAVVVVEAGEKSGALITADHALDLGREVLAVPGSVENPQARGSNALLREGARILPYPEAVLEELEAVVREAAKGREPGGGGVGETGGMPPLSREMEPLWAALSSDPRSLDEVAAAAQLPPGEALSALVALELAGWVLPCPGMRYRRA